MPEDNFRQVYVEETLENLQQAEEGLLALEKNPGSRDDINAVFRALHTIKGGAGMAGMEDVADLSHHMESLLTDIRKSGAIMHEDALDLLFTGVDYLKRIIQSDGASASGIKKQLDDLVLSLNDFNIDKIPVQSETGNESCGFIKSFDPGMIHNIAEEGNNFYLVSITLCDDCLVKIARAYLTMEALDEIAQIITVKPSLKEIESDDFGTQFFVLLTGAVSVEDLKNAVDDIAEIEKVDASIITPEEAKNFFQKDSPAESAGCGFFDNKNSNYSQKEIHDRKQSNGREFSDSIRVSTAKLESILDSVAELIIAQSRLKDMAVRLKARDRFLGMEFSSAFEESDKIIRRLQEDVMNASMIPIGGTFIRFQRMARDLAKELGKEIELNISGRETEIDKKIIEQIIDPLKHLIRNSVGHGIETPEEREAAGKPRKGVINLNAFHREGNVFIEISDDGRGIDEEKVLAKAKERNLVEDGENLSREAIQQLIFIPGLSTVKELSDVSGRGVGLDVVNTNIQNLSGHIDLYSEKNRGTRFTVKLPLTMAIIDGMMIRVGKERFIIPLSAIIEFIKAAPGDVRRAEGKGSVLRLRDELIPYIGLYQLFTLNPDSVNSTDGILVILREGKKKLALLVDEIIGQEQVVIKSIKDNMEQVAGLAGATIMGDGRVALILDITSLFRLTKQKTGFIIQDSKGRQQDEKNF